MKTKSIPLFMFAYSYGVFSLAMAIPRQKYSLWDWIITIVLNGLMYIVFSLVIFNSGNVKPLTDLFLLVFILLIISKNYILFSNYLKTYHRQISRTGNIILTVLLILMITNMDIEKLHKFRPIVTSMLCVMIVIVLLMNIKKFNPVNLYIPSSYNKLSIVNITLFDYIVPLNIVLNYNNTKAKKSVIGFIFFQVITLSVFCIFIFGCLKGNLLYSLSPLQAAFQMTSVKLIKNFDAILNYYLYFSYFSAVLLNCCAYSIIKKRFSYTGKWDLLLIIPIAMVYPKFNNELFLIIQGLIVLLLFIGKERKKYEGKS